MASINLNRVLTLPGQLASAVVNARSTAPELTTVLDTDDGAANGEVVAAVGTEAGVWTLRRLPIGGTVETPGS